MKNDVFNLNRFGRYLTTDIRNAISNFGISLLVLATLGLCLDIFSGLFFLTVHDAWRGVGEKGRIALFAITAFVTVVSSPSKLYGFFTEKRDGSAFLTLPVSTLEKSLSMIIVSCILVPAAFFIVYLSIDQLVCLADTTCGNSLMVLLNDFKVRVLGNATEGLMAASAFINSPEALLSPWWYIDDLIQIPLIFLLGALYFKKSKVAKTFGCLILLGMVLSLITTTIIGFGFKDEMEILIESGELTPFNFADYFPVLTWMIKHAVLVDTINDTVINLLVMFLIWLRVRKINH